MNKKNVYFLPPVSMEAIFWTPGVIHSNLKVTLVSWVMVLEYRPSGVGFQRWAVSVGCSGGEKLLGREKHEVPL